jgi:DNA polymerase
LEECKTYGGSLVENIVQATARDIMANGMLNAEAAGFPVVLTVHDELVTEKAPAEGDVDGLIKAMCTLPEWAKGCPIEAEGWTGFRYRK